MKKLVASASSVLAAAFVVAGFTAKASAEDVWITPELPFFEFSVGGEDYVIERNQDTSAVIGGSFAKTSRPCPPFCIQPITVAEGVRTVGELEVMQFIANYVESGDGHLVDARLINWYDAGTIPGAINLPFNLFNPNENPFFNAIMGQLGGTLLTSGQWDFSNARALLLFCNGPWCGQSPRAIRNLLSVGYPAELLYYYRGGMQSWLIMGLPSVVPKGA